MTTPSLPLESKRWQEITCIWRDNRWLYVVVGVLLGLLITPASEQITGDLNSLIGNLVPEAIGIIFTVLILERLAENRDREALKHRLLEEVRSPSSATAITALNWLRRENWVMDDTFKSKSMLNLNWEGAYIGDLNLEEAMLMRANFKNVSSALLSVKGEEHDFRPLNLTKANLIQANLSYALMPYANLQSADLWEANLQKAQLQEANLEKASLQSASLQSAILEKANLQEANLIRANLQNADLVEANLQKTNLPFVNLHNANLSEADLRGANLEKANLRGARLTDVIFNEKTILPDGHKEFVKLGLLPGDENQVIFHSHWTPDTDMGRYTDPNHPDFWEPDWVKEHRKQENSS